MSAMNLTHASVSTRHVHLFETSAPARGLFLTTDGIMCLTVLIWNEAEKQQEQET